MKKLVIIFSVCFYSLMLLCACGQSSDSCNHSLVTTEAKDSTCTEAGWDAYVSCTKCNYTTYVEKPAKGHEYITSIVQPTCIEKGYTLHSCVCGDNFTDSYTAPANHVYENTICITCGTVQKVSSGLEFQSLEDGTCYVKGLGTCADSNIVVPTSSPSGERVVAIGYAAFLDCESIITIELPKSIETIGASAFYGCTNLKNIEIPENVQTIYARAFYGCKSLESIKVPSTISLIGENAFEYCDALALNEDDSAYYIGNDDNSYLILMNVKSKDILSFEIRSETKIIYDDAFANCISLTEITIPENIIGLGNGSFYNCRSLEKIYFNSINMNDLSANNMTFADAGILSGIEFIVGNRVTKIPAFLFSPFSMTTSYTPRIEKVVFEENSVCEVIGNCAFDYCTNLESVHIPSSVITIGYLSFNHCSRLIDVYYTGTEEQWQSITIDSNNEYLTGATIHFNYNDDQ